MRRSQKREGDVLTALLIGLTVLAIAGMLALAWNSFTALETGTSKPYRYDFSVCARWTHYGKGTAYCAEYKQASECRIDRFMSGRLWQYKDYKVVPCG